MPPVCSLNPCPVLFSFSSLLFSLSLNLPSPPLVLQAVLSRFSLPFSYFGESLSAPLVLFTVFGRTTRGFKDTSFVMVRPNSRLAQNVVLPTLLSVACTHQTYSDNCNTFRFSPLILLSSCPCRGFSSLYISLLSLIVEWHLSLLFVGMSLLTFHGGVQL
jgi:hypothetical protein